MSRRFLRITLLKILFSLLVLGLAISSISHATANVNFRGNLYFRADYGDEVNTYSSKPFPDNLIERKYLESTISGELLFNKVPLGQRLRIGIRLLELQASDYDNNSTPLEDTRRVDDRIYAQLSGKQWEVWAGDVTTTFGRGLTLNLFENRDLYFDNKLRGGKASYRSKNLRVKTIYGRSREWYTVNEENVGGFNIEVRPRKQFYLGGSIVHQEGLTYEKRYMPGIYGGFNLGPVTLYGEYAQRRPDDGNVSEGDGTFLSVEASVLGLAAQIGYKYYNFGLENPFQNPPIAEREITTHLLTQHPHVPNINDQVGFEFTLSASPTEILFLDLNFSRSSQHDEGNFLPTLKQEDAAYWLLFLESEIYARDDLYLKFGIGQNEEAYPTFWEKKTGLAGETTYNLSDLWSLTWTLENMWVDDREINEQHSDQYTVLSLGRASWGSLTFIYERSSLESEVEGNRWIGGEILAEIRRNHRLLLFLGRERGGLKCSSGICRTVQAFEGARLIYEGRF